jgi:hypothetical protein
MIMVFKVLPISICTHFGSVDELPTNYIISLNLVVFSAFFFPSYKIPMPTSHSSSHAFTSIYNTNHENIITPTTYSWDANWWRIYSSCEYVVEKII